MVFCTRPIRGVASICVFIRIIVFAPPLRTSCPWRRARAESRAAATLFNLYPA
jgi:hypothetical protein